MAGGKETPRQKMIGIMYLVLMAMLALNVSDTILNAFSTLNNSLQTSTKNVNNGLTQSVNAFEQTKMKENPERARPILAKVKQAQKLAGDLDAYIEAVKKELETAGGGRDPETGELNKRDDLDVSPHIMVSQKKGYELQKKVNETREKLMALLDARDRASVTFSLEANDAKKAGNDGVKKDWPESNFGDGTPLTASITILSKIQADIKNAESAVVRKFLAKMDEALVTLDAFAAVAVAPSSYIIQGQPYQAQVFLTAYDSKQNPDITVGGSKLSTADGKGVYNVNTSKEGEYTWVGTIRVKQTDGKEKIYTTAPQKYTVARPSAVVSPDKMNVFYIGVNNPISVSAPGIPKEKLRVSISGGTLSGSGGNYTVRVSGGSEATVTVSGEISPGKSQVLSSSKFRVKKVPNPIATFGGKASGVLSAGTARGVGRLEAELKDFDFDLKFRVTKFTMVYIKPRQDAQFVTSADGSFSGQARNIINSVAPGDALYFTNVTVAGEDNSVRQLETPVYIQLGR